MLLVKPTPTEPACKGDGCWGETHNGGSFQMWIFWSLLALQETGKEQLTVGVTHKYEQTKGTQ